MKQGVFDKARQWLKGRNKKAEPGYPSAVQIYLEAGGDYCSKAIARISQMEGRIQRQCDRARRDLHKLQQQRASEPQPEAEIEAAPETTQEPEIALLRDQAPQAIQVPDPKPSDNEDIRVLKPVG